MLPPSSPSFELARVPPRLRSRLHLSVVTGKYSPIALHPALGKSTHEVAPLTPLDQLPVLDIPEFAPGATVDVTKGIYRGFRYDESYQILQHTTKESTLSDESRKALSRMRSAIEGRTERFDDPMFAKADLGTCAMCGDGGFKSTRDLIRHVHGHIGIKFQCEFCDALLTRSDALRRHVKKAHRHGHWAFEKARSERAPPAF